MSLKDDIKEVQEKADKLGESIKEQEQETSIAYDIVSDYKKTNSRLLIINILLLVALIIAIVN